MTQAYAVGKKARGFCDRCGFDYLLEDLKAEVVDLKVTGIRVCPECWDPDQPQRQLGRFPISDPQALRNPRPNGQDSGRLIEGTLSYDFTDDADGFTATSATLTHDGEDGTISMAFSVSGASALLYRSPISIDTSLYRYARMRFRFAELVPNPVQKLTFSWLRSGQSEYDPAIQAADVWLYVNGDEWHEIVWDMDNDINVSGGTSPWTGTVERIRFKFLSNDPDSTTSVEIDWVRLEPGYLDQGV